MITSWKSQELFRKKSKYYGLDFIASYSSIQADVKPDVSALVL